MPALIPILYPVVVWLGQAALTTAGFLLVEKLSDIILEAIREHYDLDENDARLVWANYLIDAFAFIGVGSKVMASKLPLKVADKLGLRAGVVAKRALSAKGAAKVAAKNAKDPKVIGLGAKVFKRLKGVSGLNWLMIAMLLQNAGDWFFFKRDLLEQTIRAIPGLGDVELPGKKEAPPGFTQNEWNGYIKSLEAAGIVGLNNEAARQSQLYSEENLNQLAVYIYGRETSQGKSTTAVAMQKALAPFLIMRGQAAPLPSSTQAKTSTPAATIPQVKVFTGVVSQGTLGSGLAFTPRPDDLIENEGELQAAFNNNAAPFIASLFSKVVAEIKVVPAIIVNGVRKTGQAQTIQNGTYKDGRPKTKTVVNKWAVADFFFPTATGGRSKIGSVTLGPTNALTFQPTASQLLDLSVALPRNLLTSDTDEIDTVVTNTPTTVIPPASAAAPISENKIGYCFIYDGYKGQVCWNMATVDRIRKDIAGGAMTLDEGLRELGKRHLRDFDIMGEKSTGEDAWANQNPNVVMSAYDNGLELVKKMLTEGGTFVKEFVERAETSPPMGASGAGGVDIAPTEPKAQPLPQAAVSAATLYEYYTALGKSLPPLSERGVLYEQLGLGQSAFYTGTAEQNTKLLRSLQGKPL